MNEIPVFPLQTVLFPGSSLRLRIFEERYQQMLRFCLETNQPFGVVLIRQGLEVGQDMVRTFSVGCTARIDESVPLGHGWSLIRVTGEERFRILEIPEPIPYPTARIMMQPLETPPLMETLRETKRLITWVGRYIHLAAVRQGKSIPKSMIHIPENPLTLIFQAADLLQIPPFEKQALLEVNNAKGLLSEVLRLYRRELSVDRDLSFSWINQHELFTDLDKNTRPFPYQWFGEKYRITGRRREETGRRNLN